MIKSPWIQKKRSADYMEIDGEADQLKRTKIEGDKEEKLLDNENPQQPSVDSNAGLQGQPDEPK